MGCGSSSNPADVIVQTDNGNTTVSSKRDKRRDGDSFPAKDTAPLAMKVPNKGISFAIDFDDQPRRPMCKKLQRLEPIRNAPKLTAATLVEKQQLAEQKRNKQLEKVKNTSRKLSRLKQNIADAKEFENTQTMEKNEKKQMSTSKLRDDKLRDLNAKKQSRDEHTIREQTKLRLKQAEENGAAFEVENDENFNGDNDELDSWLDGANNKENKDNVSHLNRENFNKNESRIISAGTIDGFSFHNANIFDAADDFYA